MACTALVFGWFGLFCWLAFVGLGCVCSFWAVCLKVVLFTARFGWSRACAGCFVSGGFGEFWQFLPLFPFG